MKIVEKIVKVNNIQKKQLDFDYIYKYYDIVEHIRDIFVVYDNKEYIGFISDSIFKLCSNENDMLYYCFRAKNELTVDKTENIEIDDIKCMINSFALIPCAFLYIKGTNRIITLEGESFVSVMESSIQKNKIIKQLKDNGAIVYCVKIPNMREKYIVPNSTNETAFPMFWCDRAQKYSREKIKNITDKSYDEVRKKHMQERYVGKYGKGKKKIYLVGPCIVSGWPYTIHEDELAYIISKKFKEYEIIKVQSFGHYYSNPSSVLEYDIYQDDIVIFIEEFDENYISIDLDMTEVLMKESKQILYTLNPIHTTLWGNKLIARQIYLKIISDNVFSKQNNDNKLLIKGSEQFLSNEMLINLDRFIEDCKYKYINKFGQEEWDKRFDKDIGAVSISANPFTNGHKYLLEYAAGKVDVLYIFIVENDLLDFSYDIRKKLIYENTATIDNVIIIDGNNIIATLETFISYYKREELLNEKIDPIQDVKVFARYIAPLLGINKRFVGEEPTDYVTNEYNKQMKIEFPQYDIELIEIPRAEINGKYISASYVREQFKKKNWKELKKFVPEATYKLFKENSDYECYKKKIKARYYSTRWLMNRLENGEKVYIYGIGRDSQLIYDLICKNYKEQIMFCAQEAINNNIMFNGKKVMNPNVLVNGMNIFIATRKCKKEIYSILIHRNIRLNVVEISDNIDNEVI